MKNNAAKILFAFCLFLLISLKVSATSYTWTGTTSTSWTTTTNWNPAGNPSTNDEVTIVTGSNSVSITANTTVSKLTINSGTIDINGKKLTISNESNFNSGAINNGLLKINGITATFAGTQFGAVVKAKVYSVFLNGSVFNDSLFIIKTADPNDNSKGGNTFNGYVSLVDSGAGAIVLSDSFPDIFNAALEVNNVSTGGIYLAHRGTGNQFNGNVTIGGSKVYSNYYGTAAYSGNITLDTRYGDIYFGYSTGSCTLASGKTISIIGSGLTSGYLYFRNFTQLDTATTITLSLTSTARLYLESGCVFNAPVTFSAPMLYLDGAKFIRTSSFTNTGSSNVTSTGGCYFGGSTTINNNPSSSITYSLANTAADTFATAAVIQNTRGIIDLNNAVLMEVQH